MAKKKKKKGDDEPLKKKKKRARDVEEDDDDDAPDEDDPTVPKRRQDIFVGLAFLSLTFLITAAAFFYQDFEEMNLKKLQAPTAQVDALPYVSDVVK